MKNRGYTPSGPTATDMPPPPPAMTVLTEECDCGKIHPGDGRVEPAVASSECTEWAVEWQPVTDLETGNTTPAGIEIMQDRDSAAYESAEFLLRHYPHWPGRIVRRTVTVGPWQPVEAEAGCAGIRHVDEPPR